MRSAIKNAFRAAAPLALLGALITVPAAPALAVVTNFTLVSGNDNRCLDSDISNATHDGTKVQVWQCLGGNNQRWTYYKDGSIRSSWDKRCLDEDIAGGTGAGTKVQVWHCIAGNLNQKWDFVGGTIVSRQDGRCLDEDIAGGTRNGSKAQVWDCNGWANQKWKVVQ